MYHNSQEWEMRPLKGNTGQAYMGISQDEKVFFKRNTSPFIAALAAEGFTPKLRWTQRTYTGDVLTAQEWAEGNTLSEEDMTNQEVINLIKSIHENHDLVTMLRRVEGKEFGPLELIELYYSDLAISLQNHGLFNQIAQNLTQSIDEDFFQTNYVVCHGDLNHHNFLMTSDQKLYLVDWDSVKIADPLYDITFLLCRYFSPSEWMDWFDKYEFEQDESFFKRVKWYSQLACLNLIKQYFSEDRHYQLNEAVILLRNIYEN